MATSKNQNQNQNGTGQTKDTSGTARQTNNNRSGLDNTDIEKDVDFHGDLSDDTDRDTFSSTSTDSTSSRSNNGRQKSGADKASR